MTTSHSTHKDVFVSQVPTGGVPIVHGNPTWGDRTVWVQAGRGGHHPVHPGCYSTMGGFFIGRPKNWCKELLSVTWPIVLVLRAFFFSFFVGGDGVCDLAKYKDIFLSAHQTDGERGPGGRAVGSTCQELFHPPGDLLSQYSIWSIHFLNYWPSRQLNRYLYRWQILRCQGALWGTSEIVKVIATGLFETNLSC